MNEKYRWIIYVVIVIVLLILIKKFVFADAKWGGIVYGRSHENGGVKGYLKDSGELLEVEAGEGIITKGAMEIKSEYICEGTPAGIASKLNEEGGGVSFDENGNCRIK